jgi:hypothetical protein
MRHPGRAAGELHGTLTLNELAPLVYAQVLPLTVPLSVSPSLCLPLCVPHRVSHRVSLTVSLTVSPSDGPSLSPCPPHRLSHRVPLTVSLTVPPSPSLPLCLPHRLSHCVSLTVSLTVPPSPSLPLCLPHRLSHCVPLTVSLTVSPSPCLSLCLPQTPFTSPEAFHAHVVQQLQGIVADLFTAAAAYPLGIFPLHNTFDLFGLDFLVDTGGKLWLLEVNSDPSLSLFEERLRSECAAMLDGAVELVAAHVADVRSQSSLGDAKSSPGEAKSSLGDAKSSPGDAKSSLGDPDASVVGGWHRVLVIPPRWSPEDGRRRLGSLIKVSIRSFLTPGSRFGPERAPLTGAVSLSTC